MAETFDSYTVERLADFYITDSTTKLDYRVIGIGINEAVGQDKPYELLVADKPLMYRVMQNTELGDLPKMEDRIYVKDIERCAVAKVQVGQ